MLGLYPYKLVPGHQRNGVDADNMIFVETALIDQAV